jgi:hypothetical protein
MNRALLITIAQTLVTATLQAQITAPDPREIPIPPIQTVLGDMPGVNDLPDRPDMPDVLTMNDGTQVTTVNQWPARRQEMKRILEYYALGLAPPPPGNVKGREIKSMLLNDGKVRYQIVKLSFGPDEKLSLTIGIFVPVTGGPVPAVIMIGLNPPGFPPLPRLPLGPNQGQNKDVLLLVGPATQPSPMTSTTRRSRRPIGPPTDPETTKATAVKTPPSATPTAVGPSAIPASSPPIPAMTGASSAPGHGVSPVSSIICRPIRRSTPTD